MTIQRYLPKDRKKLDIFGDQEYIFTYHFLWYMQDNKIGIRGNPSTEAEQFFGGLLVVDEELIINSYLDGFGIKRLNNPFGVIQGIDAGIKETVRLVEFMNNHELMHMYVSFLGKNNYARLLTFSSTEPSSELYDKGNILPVTFNNKPVYKNSELEELIEKVKTTTFAF
ncbi:hypothetical protein HOK68_00925 [Candidatus Woesearchaeota archaeon]|jgi:hypothetical protein|nr:hypothetical protein [Candidatus Woesearchaeota archaeon]MBT4388057.1 hypothetical protein [Candidatus Woesearchaeota archaeon]MBT4596322.1 hypothetical protein [Candidatus Woesearchaeota archaeon]MBT5740824.1 hypothetical protein [Candidatus Woesearchaeota archaeon]MBT6505324.1 hypothetical protein [Candidatus Woesearchaeota archaeon]